VCNKLCNTPATGLVVAHACSLRERACATVLGFKFNYLGKDAAMTGMPDSLCGGHAKERGGEAVTHGAVSAVFLPKATNIICLGTLASQTGQGGKCEAFR
jgi:hypothetical protein